jgi:hypothetical protein
MGADLYIVDSAMADSRGVLTYGDAPSIYAGSENEGYFRDSYNGTSVMWTLELSWWADITPMLDDEGYLKGEQLAKFRSMVSEPVQILPSRSELESNFCMIDGENTLESWNEYFIQKRQNLVEFVDRAIAADSRILCSL